MSKKLSKHEQNLAHSRYLAGVDFLSRTTTTLIKYGSLVACVFFMYKTLVGMAGRETLAKVGISLVSDLKVNEWLCYVFGGGGVAWAVGERRLRRKNQKRLTDHTKALETTIDPGRSSSRLSSAGTTRDGD